MLREIFEEIIPEHRPKHGNEWATFCINPDCPCRTPGHRHLYVNVEKCKSRCVRCGYSFNPTEIIASICNLEISEAENKLFGVGQNRVKICRKRLLKARKGSKMRFGMDREEKSRIEPPRHQIQLDYTSVQYLKSRGVDEDLAEKLGITLVRRGFWRDRIIIPIKLNGEYRGFAAQALFGPPKDLSELKKRKWVKETGYKKILYPPGFKSSLNLFGLDGVNGGTVVLTEGIWDKFSVGESSVAIFGSKLYSGQISLLKSRQNIDTVVVMLDGDAYDEATKAIRMIRQMSTFRVGRAKLPSDKDPGDLSKSEIEKILNSVSFYDNNRISQLKFKIRNI